MRSWLMATLGGRQHTRRCAGAQGGARRLGCAMSAPPYAVGRRGLQPQTRWMALCLAALVAFSHARSPFLHIGVLQLHGASVAGAEAQPRGPTLLSCLVLACSHAPWPPSHRILVFLLPPAQLWIPMELNNAGRCLLRRFWRSARPALGCALGFFCVVFALVLDLRWSATALVIDGLMSPLASLPPRPVGQPGGAPSIARATAPPAVLALRTMDLAAGTPVSELPAAPPSSRACAR